MLLDRDIIHDAFAQLPEETRWNGFRTRETTLAKYPYTVSIPRDTDIVSIEVVSRDPQAAADFANMIAQTDMAKHVLRVGKLTEQTVQPIDHELSQCTRELDRAIDAVTRYKQAHAITDMSAEVSGDAQGLINLQTIINDAERELTRQEALQQTIAQRMHDMPALLDSKVIPTDPLVQAIDLEIEQLQQKRDSLLQDFQPTAQEVRAVDAQLALAHHRRDEAVRSHPATANGNHNPLYDNLEQQRITSTIAIQDARTRLLTARSQLAQMHGHVANLPDKEKQMAMLTSRVDELHSKLAELASQKSSLSLNSYTELPSVTPTMIAHADFIPVSPRYKTSILLLLVVAIVVAIGLAALRAQFDDRFHSAEMLEEISGQRVLASFLRYAMDFAGW